MRFGVLFTNRGCTQNCKFCQTPAFQTNVSKIGHDELERVVKYYYDIGINIIGIFDENFGQYRKHAEEVVQILNKYNMYWACMSRADIVSRQVSNWTSNGGRFIAAGVGIESLNSETLAEMNKKYDENQIISDLKTIKKNNVGILGYYIIGFENETEESIRRDIKKLIKLRIDVNQITIVTPLPKTKLWYELESKYGIFEQDYTKYDTKHLVWNHPNISKSRLEALLDWGLRTANPRKSVIKMAYRFHKLIAEKEGFKAFTTFPVNIYNTKKYGSDGNKIFFRNDEELDLIRYKFENTMNE